MRRLWRGIMGDLKQTVTDVVILDTARDVQTGCIGRHNRVAALEQCLGGDRDRLARLGKSCDLHKDRLARCQPFDLAQKRRSIRRFQEHAALPFDGPIRNGAIDRTGARRIAVDQQILQLAVHHKGSGLNVSQMVQNDCATFHEVSLCNG